MVATNKLRGIIVEKGLSQRYVAHHLGITENTFYSKMKRGVFDSDEMEAMINLLEIQNPCEIFFASAGGKISILTQKVAAQIGTQDANPHSEGSYIPPA